MLLRQPNHPSLLMLFQNISFLLSTVVCSSNIVIPFHTALASGDPSILIQVSGSSESRFASISISGGRVFPGHNDDRAYMQQLLINGEIPLTAPGDRNGTQNTSRWELGIGPMSP